VEETLVTQQKSSDMEHGYNSDLHGGRSRTQMGAFGSYQQHFACDRVDPLCGSVPSLVCFFLFTVVRHNMGDVGWGEVPLEFTPLDQ